MLRRFSVNFAVLSMFVDAGLTLLALVVAVAVRPRLPHLPLMIPVASIQVPQPLYLIIPLLWVGVFLLASVYDPKRNYKVVNEFQAVTIASGIATLAAAGLLYLFFRDVSRWLFIIFAALDLVFLLAWRAATRLVSRVALWPAVEHRVLIVGAGKVGRRAGEMIRSYGWMGLTLVGFLDDDTRKRDASNNGGGLSVLGPLKDIRWVVEEHKIDDVVVALPQRAYSRLNELALTLHDTSVRVRVIPDYFSLSLYRASVEDFGGMPLINLRAPALNDVQRTVKRFFDLVVGGFLTLISLPLMPLIAVAVKLDSPGPVLYYQERVGENGRQFTMVKFRTMIDGADEMRDQVTERSEDGKVLFKRFDDPRVTRVGRVLRRTSLDELPQLLNVLKGDMSLVGPRPELPWLVDLYEPWQRRRFAMPPGLTGWWQVNGRSDNPMHLHTEDDLYYVQNYSLWMDIYILLRTPWVVLRGRGAF